MPIKYLLQYKRKDNEPIPILKLVKTCSDIVCTIMDNWFYLGRVSKITLT